jgi:O-antigen/teichoic acid export membrane protein
MKLTLMNSKVFSNYFGTILDKAVPLIISVLLVKYIAPEDYTKWSIYYSYLIVVHTFAFSPIFIKFAQKYNYKSVKANSEISIFSGSLVLVLFTISSSFYYIYFGFDTRYFLLEILGFLFFPIYEYIAYIDRFIENDIEYLKFSAIKFAIFIVCLIILCYLQKKINYNSILLAFVLSYINILFKRIRDISISFNFCNSKEFLSISIYGLLSSFTASFDKYIMTFKSYSVEDIAAFSYIVTLIALPSVFIETIKKLYNPIIFKSFAGQNFTIEASEYKREIKLYVSSAVLLQLFVPFASFFSLYYIGLVNVSYLREGFFETFIVLNISTSIFILYHFINQYYFYYSRTKSLILFQIIAFVISSLFLFYFGDDNSLINIGIVKSVQLLVIFTITFVAIKIYDRRIF